MCPPIKFIRGSLHNQISISRNPPVYIVGTVPWATPYPGLIAFTMSYSELIRLLSKRQISPGNEVLSWVRMVLTGYKILAMQLLLWGKYNGHCCFVIAKLHEFSCPNSFLLGFQHRTRLQKDCMDKHFFMCFLRSRVSTQKFSSHLKCRRRRRHFKRELGANLGVFVWIILSHKSCSLQYNLCNSNTQWGGGIYLNYMSFRIIGSWVTSALFHKKMS